MALSLIAVGFALTRLLLPIPLISPTSQAPAASVSGTATQSIVVNLGPNSSSGGLETPTSGSPTSTLAVTLIGPPSPADAWANAVLDDVTSLFDAGLRPGDGFAWWQSQTERAPLDYHDGLVYFGVLPLTSSPPSRIVVSVPDPSDINQLHRVGLIEANGGSLTVTALSSSPLVGGRSWILTNVNSTLPISALVIQAAARSITYVAAYDDTDSSVAQLVILGLDHTNEVVVSTATAPPISNSQTLTAPIVPTATRAPDIGLGRLISGRLDTVIDALADIPEPDVAAYVDQHSPPGPLTWTETGPRFNGRPMSVNEAVELNVEYLSHTSPTNAAVKFFTAEYQNDVTHLLEDHVGFQGHRMDEIVYWLVYHSTERRGTLIVTYDDFGARQSIGIIGFSPFSQSP